MLNTHRVYNGAIVAPHHLASQSGLRVLQEGGNAIEAMIATAATLVVAYPHMNGLGGDNFWLLHAPGDGVQGIDACGGAAALATIDFYKEAGQASIPDRGPLAALTMAGAVSGWQRALNYSETHWGGRLPLSRLLEDAIAYARDGIAVTETQARNTTVKFDQLAHQPGFAEAYLVDGAAPGEGHRFVQARIAATLQQLVDRGLNDFYQGDLAASMAQELEATGSPLRRDDFAAHSALDVAPLSLDVMGHTVYNMPPPTQGLASLLLLGIYERLGVAGSDTFDFVHRLVEATKCAFRVRDQHVSDPQYMATEPSDWLTGDMLTKLASQADLAQAAPWPDASIGGDTVWMGAIDSAGRAVSFIQSVYWEFGSGVVLPTSGITWQNRGTSFSLDKTHHNHLLPGRRPFHTIQPALARLADGRVMAYGTMGGEGQPQTQAMLFARHVLNGEPLQQTVTAPRWLLGRTWGSEATQLRVENRLPETVVAQLQAAGHDIEVVGAFEEIMGHAGALVHHPDGVIEAAADPRSDGVVAGF